MSGLRKTGNQHTYLMKHTGKENKLMTEAKTSNPEINWIFLFLWTLATIFGMIS